jgi:hypothetical protein
MVSLRGLQMIIGQINYPKCECHDCTQARWRMSIQGQPAGNVVGNANQELMKASQQQYADSQYAGGFSK